jgi:hypothetical protein
MDSITAQMLFEKYAETTIKRWEYGEDIGEGCTYEETLKENFSYYADDPDMLSEPMEPWEYFMEWLETAENINDDEQFMVTSAFLELMCRMCCDDEKWLIEYGDKVLFEGTPDEAREHFPIES